MFIVQAYHTSQYVVSRGGIFSSNIRGIHCAGLSSDFSVRGAALRHFLSKWCSSFAGNSNGKMNVQSSCALNTRYNRIVRGTIRSMQNHENEHIRSIGHGEA
jgi:hypothetical protein